MEQYVVIHPRVSQRHPELSTEDVLAAWDNCLRSSNRNEGALEDYVAVGVDRKGRIIEMIAVLKPDDTWLIYHAFTPPSNRVLQELGLDERRKR